MILGELEFHKFGKPEFKPEFLSIIAKLKNLKLETEKLVPESGKVIEIFGKSQEFLL